jgi:hypothetical protein
LLGNLLICKRTRFYALFPRFYEWNIHWVDLLRLGEDVSSLIRWLTLGVFLYDNMLLNLGNDRVVKSPVFLIDVAECDVMSLGRRSNVTYDDPSVESLPSPHMAG